MIKPEDISVSQVFLTENEKEKIRKIANMTHNTWQSNRTIESKIADTSMGKVCEKAILKHISNQGLFIIDYDDYRLDDFSNHAPVDFIICPNQNSANKIIEMIAKKSLSHKSAEFSLEERKMINKEKAFLCEVKSTRIIDRHKTNSNVDVNKILNRDDFLTYPKYIRKSDSIHSIDDYVKFCIQNNLSKSKEDVLKKEKKNMANLYFRAYLDEANNNVFLIGVIDRKNFINKSYVKKMSQKNKSENAIYLATSLRNGKSIEKTIKTVKSYYKDNKMSLSP
jgi:hypothetical protein